MIAASTLPEAPCLGADDDVEGFAEALALFEEGFGIDETSTRAAPRDDEDGTGGITTEEADVARFFVADFFTVFFAADFFTVFFAAVFFTADFFTVFLAAVFFTAVFFLATDFLAALFFTAAFLTAGFFFTATITPCFG
jgi:hypothetical protein